MQLSTSWRAVTLLGIAGLCRPAYAQDAGYLQRYLPSLVPGFDQQQGVTVLSRLRPLYQDQGVRLGPYVVRGGLDEKLGYDSNITGAQNGPSSSFIETNPSVSAQSDFSRNRLGIAADLDNFTYFSAPHQSHTNYSVALGGGLDFERDKLDAGYTHIHANELGTDPGAVAFNAPIPFDLDVVRGAYTIDLGRLTFTPNAQLSLYQFSNSPVPNQSYRDRTVLEGGITTRYELSEQRALVLVVQGASTHYIRPQAGIPSYNSQTVQVMPGIDYQATGPWRYQLLVGGELRNFDSSQYGSRFAPVFEGKVIYTPTGLTTVTATLDREIEDTSAEGSSGYTQTGIRLVVDHELRRNLLLQGSASFHSINYFQNLGNSTSYGFGGSATYLIDRHLSAFATYSFLHQDGSSTRALVNNAPTSSAVQPTFTQNIALIGLRWRL